MQQPNQPAMMPLTPTSMRAGEGDQTLVLSFGNITKSDLADDGEHQLQVNDSANDDERPRTDPDVP